MYHYYPTTSSAGLPFTVAHVKSGNIVYEWFPQMTTFSMLVIGVPVFSATCQTALSWSNLVIAAKFYLGKSLAWVAVIKQIVLTGLPTIKVFTSLWAQSLRALACGMNILAFYCKRSTLSIPFYIGLEPTNKAAYTSMKPTW